LIAGYCNTLPNAATIGVPAANPDGDHIMSMTLLNLRANLTLLPQALSPERHRRALLATNRLSGTASPATLPAGPALLELLDACHATDKTTANQAAEERRAIEAALAMAKAPAELIATVTAGTATLADAARATGLQGWDDKRASDHRAALDTYARVIEGLPLDSISAREAAIAKRLQATPYTAFGVQAKTFANLKSRILTAVRLVDMHGRYRVKKHAVSPAWQALLDQLPGAWPRKLWPLVTFALMHGLEPVAITAATLDALEAELQLRQDANARGRVQHVVYAWEKLDHVAFGLTPLPRRYSDRAASALGWDALPEPFRRSWLDYVSGQLARQRGREPGGEWDYADHYSVDAADEFAHLFDAAQTPLAGTGLDDGLNRYRAAVTYAAYADPAPMALVDFRQVLTLAHLRGAVTAVLERQQQRWQPGNQPVEKKNNYRWSIALALCLLAERAGAVAGPELARMKLVKLDVDPKVRRLERDPTSGAVKAVYNRGSVMGPRHRRMLDAIVGNDIAFVAWAEAPDRLWARAMAAVKAGKAGPEAAYDALVACLHEVQRCCPLRIENLAEIRIGGPEQNLSLVGERGSLQLAAREIKCGSGDLSVPLTPLATARLRDWCKRFRPILVTSVKAARDNPYLIPARGHGHKLARSVGALYVARNRRCGVYLTVHVGRHLSAWLLIEAGFNLDVVSRVLGHASPETTRQYYATLNRMRDLRLYQDTLARRLSGRSPASRTSSHPAVRKAA